MRDELAEDPAALVRWAIKEEVVPSPAAEVDTRAKEYIELLQPRRFDIKNPPPEPVPVFMLRDAVIATPGNLVAIQAQVKAGKSAVVGALLASMMQPTGDCLGFVSGNPDGGAVIHFDTEQSPADHHRGVLRALRRAGKVAAPEWLRSYRLADVTTTKRREVLRFEMESAVKDCKFIRAVIIDGVADICVSPNDEMEAIALVDELHQLAIMHATVVVCVLHENPGSEFGKMRGHLGSQLERKAETNLRLSKDGEVTCLYSEKARNAHIPKDAGPRFKWSDEAQMHVSTDARAATKADEKREEWREEAALVFEGVPSGMGLSYSTLIEAIEKATGRKREGARTAFKAMKKYAVITPTSNNRWMLSKW